MPQPDGGRLGHRAGQGVRAPPVALDPAKRVAAVVPPRAPAGV
ncbi:hypothetical protein AB0K98_11270 [Streptomyces werraensis]